MNHTQGKWEVEPSDCMTAHYVLRSAYDYFEEGYESDDPQTAIALRKEDEANARLIAAAPDLLTACKFALDAAEDSELYPLSAMDKLEKAIAKAEQADEPESEVVGWAVQ